MKKIFLTLLITTSILFLNGESLINEESTNYNVVANAELGFIYIAEHTIQNGEPGTNFNYVTQGGQDVLFPYTRFELGLDIKKHNIRLLYQPLLVETSVNFFEDVVVDGVTFTKDTAMDLTYSFPFWRATYLYDFISSDSFTFNAGLALQIRNASIIFSAKNDISGDRDITVSQNIGPVPALAIGVNQKFNNGLSLNFEATGSYASSAFFNGASFSFEGSLLDTSLSLNFDLKNDTQWYILARFLGGSATGNSEYVAGTWSESRSSYTDNQLKTIAITTGVRVK